MGKIEFINRCRKEQQCDKCKCIIPVGTSYYKGVMFRSKPIIRCTKCGLKSYEVTSSEYISAIGRIVEDWKEDFEIGDSTVEGIVEALREQLEICQDNFENIPEQLQEGNAGQLLQERIDELESVIDELEGYGDWNEFLSKGYDSLDAEEQEVIDAEQEKRNGAEYEDWYFEFCQSDNKVAARWQENVEEEITSFIDETLCSLTY